MKRSLGLSYLLAVLGFFGAAGIHRFYLRRPITGIIYLFTGGLFLIGTIYDLATMARRVDDLNRDIELEEGRREPHWEQMPRRPYAASAKPQTLTEDDKEKLTLNLAQRFKGYLTATELASHSRMSLKEAKDTLDRLAKEGFADIRVTDGGAVLYHFTGFVSADDRATARTVLD